MNDSNTQIMSIFSDAVACDSPEARAAHLDRACGDDAAVRAQVEELLKAHEEAGDFLKGRESPADFASLTDKSPREAVGTIIGPYKLLEQIGEGGMGVVYMAEQVRPVRRRVALKVIKPGMDTREVIGRFEAERQALAMMEHPNIAKVHDAGATENGRPYFVMELVQGVPITNYCDECNLTTRERLELFITVCQAVQHAHQKGVIHRDLKPTNILVAIQDGRPAPKIIDFGVAKAIYERLTEYTLATGFAQMIGTPLYMSPEQAELSPLGADTRSDIYSLGVLLYELLTGTTPFDKDRIHAASYDEVRRILREEEPPRPSARLSTLAAELATTIAEDRRTDPRRLRQTVRGELDWIVSRCLEKDRNRRYDSASGLVADVERYLADEPVQACPPSATYQLRKFARRNKAVLVTATLVAAALILGTVASTWQAIRASRAEAGSRQREAETQAVLDFVENKIIAAARPEGEAGGLGHDVTLRRAVEAALPFMETSLTDQPLIEARLRMTLGKSFRLLGEAGIAADQYHKARALFTKELGPDHCDTLSSMSGLANSYVYLGQHAEALKLGEETLALQKATLGPDHPNTLGCMNNLANSYADLGRHADALQLREETLALQKATLGPDHHNTLGCMNNLAKSYGDLGRYADAVRLDEETLARMKARLGQDHPDTLMSMNNLANHYGDIGRHADALKLHEETLALWKAKLGPDDHPHSLRSMNNLAYSMNNVAWALVASADPAARNTGRALELAKKMVELVPDEDAFWGTLAVAHYRAGDWKAAVAALEMQIELQKGGNSFDFVFLAMAHWQLGHKDEARRWYAQAVEWTEKNNTDNEGLRGFRAEAAELLGITEPQSATSPQPLENEVPNTDNPTPSSPLNPKP